MKALMMILILTINVVAQADTNLCKESDGSYLTLSELTESINDYIAGTDLSFESEKDEMLAELCVGGLK